MYTANIPTREHRSKTFGFSFSTKKASSKRKSSLQNSELQQDTSKDSLQRNEAHNSTVSEAIDGADGPVTDQSNKEDAEEKTNNDNEAVASLKIDEELTVTSEQPSSTGADESEVSKEKQLQTSASVDHYKTDQAKGGLAVHCDLTCFYFIFSYICCVSQQIFQLGKREARHLISSVAKNHKRRKRREEVLNRFKQPFLQHRKYQSQQKTGILNSKRSLTKNYKETKNFSETTTNCKEKTLV